MRASLRYLAAAGARSATDFAARVQSETAIRNGRWRSLVEARLSTFSGPFFPGAMSGATAAPSAKTKTAGIPRPFRDRNTDRSDYFICAATKSQFTRFQNASTYFGRALR